MNPFYRFTTSVIRVGMRCIWRWEVRGLENIPPGGVLFAGNHISFYDPEIICAAVRPRSLTWLAKQELFRIPVVGTMLRWINTIPVNQNSADHRAMRVALRRLREGHMVGIFPEGGRSLPGSERPLSAGVAFLAHRAEVPVLPVAIAGTQPMLYWRGWLPIPNRVRIQFGQPMPPPHGRRLSDMERRAYTERVMDEVAALAKTFIGQP